MKRLICCGMVVLAAFAVMGATQVRTLNDWIGALGGADEQARIEARQMLPRFGVDAVPGVLGLLSNSDAKVWWAAMRVLEDIANMSGAPGHDADRAAMTGYFMRLIAPEQPQEMKVRGLRLLPLVVPEGYDVTSIAALLAGDPVIREKARAALREINTTEAALALAGALAGADPEFQAALLDALALMNKAAALPQVLPMLESTAPAVRAAAARAIAWTGDPQYQPKLLAVYQNADDLTRHDAGDALVRHGYAMGKQGGHWNETVNAFNAYIDLFTDPVLKSAAIVGLGAYGDETAVARIEAVIAGEGGRAYEPAAMEAFAGGQGANFSRALVREFPNFSAELQPGLLALFGRRQDALFLDTLLTAAKSEDAVIRSAAMSGLAASGLPGAVPALVEYAQSCTGEERAGAVDQLRRLAEKFRKSGDKDAAGRIFLGLYQLADTDELKAYALDGMKQFPTSEAFDVISKSISEEELATLPVGTLAGIAKALYDAGRPEEGARLIEKIIPRMTAADTTREAMQYLAGVEGMSDRLGFVRAWRIVGPFPWLFAEGFTKANIGEPNVDLNATYPSGDKTLAWQSRETGDVLGLVDLMGMYGEQAGKTAYAYAEIAVPEAKDVVVRTGSDDGIKVWLNGQSIIENNIDRGCAPDQDQGAGRLQAGVNSILVQVTQILGGWNFCLRLTQPDGAPLAFERVE